MYNLDTPKYDWDFNTDKKMLSFLINKRMEGEISKEEFEKLRFLNSKIFGYTEFFSKKLYSIFSQPLGLKVWNWQDNIVYDYQKNRVIKVLAAKKYNSNENIIQYYRRKYKILKRFLWKYIPDTYFLEWEVSNHLPCHYNNLENYNVKHKTIYTVQRKVKWYTLKDLPANMKNNENFLTQLRQLYENYIRLKLYVHFLEFEKFGKAGNLSFRMDIGDISKKLDVLDENLIWYKTQNIMYDVENWKMLLIDFDSWSYDNQIAQIFDDLENTDKNTVLGKGEIILQEMKKENTKITNWKMNNFFKNANIKF